MIKQNKKNDKICYLKIEFLNYFEKQYDHKNSFRFTSFDRKI